MCTLHPRQGSSDAAPAEHSTAAGGIALQHSSSSGWRCQGGNAAPQAVTQTMTTCCRLGRTLMRLNISADMGVGSFVFFAVSLLLATILESPACATCYQVGHRLPWFQCLSASQTCKAQLVFSFPTKSHAPPFPVRAAVTEPNTSALLAVLAAQLRRCALPLTLRSFPTSSKHAPPSQLMSLKLAVWLQTLVLGAAHLKAMALCMSALYFMEPVVASVDNPQILQVPCAPSSGSCPGRRMVTCAEPLPARAPGRLHIHCSTQLCVPAPMHTWQLHCKSCSLGLCMLHKLGAALRHQRPHSLRARQSPGPLP